MRISWSRTGGFAGISQDKSLDTNSLTDEENQQILTLVAAVDFFNLPTRIASQSTYPDSFEYLLTVEDGTKEHSVIIAETALTGKLSSLVQLLNQIISSK
jgi:glutamate mutase epsilon subunit